VSHRRIRLKIPPGYLRPWRPEEDRLLGGPGKEELGRRFGRTKLAIAARRRKLNIPAPLRPRPLTGAANNLRSWTEAEEKLLGTEPDQRLAEKLGRSLGAVTERRSKLRIPNQYRQNRLWSAEEDKLLGTMPDEELARQLGRTMIAVKMRRSLKGIPDSSHPAPLAWKADEIRLLGTKPDRDVAAETGRTLESVRLKRLKMGIRGFERPLQRPWTQADDALLGKWPDAVLAEKLNRTVGSVSRRRTSMGVPVVKAGLSGLGGLT